MIIKALSDYYERKSAEPDSDIPKPGWFMGKLDFSVVLNSDGDFVSLRCLKQPNGKKMQPRPTLLPYIGKQALKHTNSGSDANLLWDNASFVLGVGNKGNKKISSFLETLEHYLAPLHDEGVTAVIRFISKIQNDPEAAEPIIGDVEYGKEISKGLATFSFTLYNDEYPLIFQRPAVANAISVMDTANDNTLGTCLVTGEQNTPLETCHTVIKNIYNVDKDPILVSFNKEAFNSYGKQQSINSPVSKKTAFAYTTALNYLLRKGSPQRIQVGDASTVFWAKEPNAMEEDFSLLLGEPQEGHETVSYDKIRDLLSAVKTGILPNQDDCPFYVLGLSPNASRIAVRFWYDGTIREMKERIAQHFDDIEIVRAPHDREFISLFRLLLATATEHKADNIPPNLGGDTIRAVLGGLPYPRTLLANAIRRCKAEQKIPHARAAIIKGVLNRDNRFNRTQNKEDITMSLNNESTQIGYVLGRLFAVFERIQEQAQTGLNKTIRDTYFGAACSNPLVVFKRLQDLSIHHLAKIRNSGKSTVWLDKLMQEVMDKVPAEGIPRTLNLEEQGRFAIGYYHQRQDFFKKHETNNEKGEE